MLERKSRLSSTQSAGSETQLGLIQYFREFPLLAVSRNTFFWLKLINIGFGLLFGVLGLYALP